MSAATVVFGPGECWSVNRCMRPVVALVCAWEAAAIIGGNAGRPWPTVTSFVHQSRRTPWRMLTWAAFAWLSYHLFVEADGGHVVVEVLNVR